MRYVNNIKLGRQRDQIDRKRGDKVRTLCNILLKINVASAFLMAMALDSPSYIPCYILTVNLAYIAIYMIINKGVE